MIRYCSYDELKARLTVISIPLVMVVLTSCLFAVDLCHIQDIEQDQKPPTDKQAKDDSVSPVILRSLDFGVHKDGNKPATIRDR